MICGPILVDNWQRWKEYFHTTKIESLMFLIDLKKIETVEYREIKKVLECDSISVSDKNKIKKERKLANNRRAARNFRERGLKTEFSDIKSVETLKKVKDSLLREKERLLKETEYYKERIVVFEAEY
ncbi:hypothetical protein LOD99_122 [Oopsacas minuta]|uniref:Basic leucine zipper domain-containing protein n=1 Tax=Oopsacas minuta TaxID=111878 RepID=A0AAV7K853_9METZ|nr:hypothetical protein LOD99_122 [Oopsacas minuta]